jgi:hypothetical protein
VSNDLFAARRETKQRAASAAATYRALKDTRKLSSHRIITYRCPDRCLLLDVLNLPAGVIFRQPGYKLPPAVNDATSSESGRAKHAGNGNSWNPRTYFAEDCIYVSTDCAHVHQVVLDKTEIQADLDAGHCEMTVLADGERRAR